jgi:hypothetical protein
LGGEDGVAFVGWVRLAVVVLLSWELSWWVVWVVWLAALGGGGWLGWAVVVSAFPLLAVAPVTGWLLGRVWRCTRGDIEVGGRGAVGVGGCLG